MQPVEDFEEMVGEAQRFPSPGGILTQIKSLKDHQAFSMIQSLGQNESVRHMIRMFNWGVILLWSPSTRV